MMRAVVVIGLCVLCAACDLVSGPDDPNDDVNQVIVTPSQTRLAVGETTTVSAIAKNESSRVLTGRRTTWTTSDASVAVVSAAGIVTAKGNGSAQITATIGRRSASVSISVRLRAFLITLSPASLSVAVGESRVLQAAVRDSLGNALDVGTSWTSSAPGILALNGSGASRAAAGMSPGTATITVSAENRLVSAIVVVTPIALLSGVWDFTQQLVDPRTNSVCTDTGSVLLVQTQATLNGGGDQIGTCVTYSQVVGNAKSTTVTHSSVSSASATLTLSTATNSCVYAGDVSGDPATVLAGTVTCGSYNGTWTARRGLAIANVRFAPSTFPDEMLRGATRIVPAELTNSAGQRAFRRVVEWSSTNPLAVTIAPGATTSATLRAGGVGLATVTARVEGVSFSAEVAVKTVVFAAVAAGAAQTCATTTDAATYCWGSEPARVASAPAFTSISVGAADACGLDQAGATYCWTASAYLSNGDASPPVIVPAPPFATISAGGYSDHYYYYVRSHTCATTPDFRVYCWGDNASGQLGNGTTFTSADRTPAPISSQLRFATVSAGGQHTCALTAGGQAYCWGDNSNGQLGTGIGASSTTPVPVSGALTFTLIAAGAYHTCALTAVGAAWCWGLNSFGQLGVPGNVSRSPAAVGSGIAFSAIVTGDIHTCALSLSGAPFCWGGNYNGELGRAPSSTLTLSPAAVPTSVTFATLSTGAGARQTCGRALDSRVYCWGSTYLVGAGLNHGFGPVAVLGQQ